MTSVTFVDYKGTAGIRKIDPDPDEVWSVAFQPYSEAGVPSATPFTVSSLTVYAAKVGFLAAKHVPGTYYQDKDQGLHFQVQIDVTLLHQTTETEVAIWLDFAKGEGWVQQNSVRVSGGALSLRIGQPVSGPSGQSRPGDIWVPAPGQENWKAAVYPGYSPGTTTLPPGTVTALFSPVVPSVGPCFPDDLTNAEFLVDPLSQTGDRCIYAPTNSGWVWKYYKLRVTLPTIAKDPWFWHCFVTVQKGHKTTGTCLITGGNALTKTSGPDFSAAMVGWALHVGTATERTIATFVNANQVTLNAAVPNGAGQGFELWNHAPDSEGIDEHPNLYLGRWHRASPQAPFGISSDAVATIDFPSENIDFTYPLAKNPDQSTNLDRDFRFRLYAVSHANDNIPSTGAPAVPFSYQVIAFQDADHFDLTPSLLPAIHDGTQINEKTLGAGLAGGSGLLPFVNADPVSPLYADLAGLHFRAASGVIVENPPGSGHYELAKTIIDLAQAVNFDTTNFKIAAGAFLVNAIAVNSLIAGDALFAGQATFAYKLGAVEGGKVTISSGGLTIASTITNPVATLAVNSTGLSFVRDIFTGSTFIGRNRLDLTSSGITVQSQNASLTPTAQIIINTGPPASIQIVTNGHSMGLTSNGITIADAFGNRVDLDSANGLRLTNGTNVVTVSATGIKVFADANHYVEVKTSGVAIFGGTLTSPVINGGSLSITTNQGTVLIRNDTNGIQVSAGSGPTAQTTRVSTSVITIGDATYTSALRQRDLLVGGGGTPNTTCGFDTDPAHTPNGLIVGGINCIGLDGKWKGTLTTPTLNATDAIQVNGFECCNSSGIWKRGTETVGDVIAARFGIYAVAFGAGTPAAPKTFTTVDGKTVTVIGGLITSVA